MHRLLLTVVLTYWDTTEVTALTVDAQHPSDVVSVAIPESEQYQVTHIEAASLRPFCLAVTAGDPKPLWEQCFRAGFVSRTMELRHAGGDGAAFNLILTNPVPGPRLQTLVRMSVSRVGGTPP